MIREYVPGLEGFIVWRCHSHYQAYICEFVSCSTIHFSPFFLLTTTFSFSHSLLCVVPYAWNFLSSTQLSLLLGILHTLFWSLIISPHSCLNELLSHVLGSFLFCFFGLYNGPRYLRVINDFVCFNMWVANLNTLQGPGFQRMLLSTFWKSGGLSRISILASQDWGTL